jgi:hypothetical protein
MSISFPPLAFRCYSVNHRRSKRGINALCRKSSSPLVRVYGQNSASQKLEFRETETAEAQIFEADIGVDINESGIGLGLGGSGGVFVGSGSIGTSGPRHKRTWQPSALKPTA